MDLTQGLHVLLAEDVAIGGLHRDPHGITQVGQVVTVLEHLLDVGVAQRNHFLEAGLRAYLRSLIEQEDADQQADQDYRRAVVENQPLKEGGRLLLVLAHAKAPGLLLLAQIGASRGGEVNAALPHQDQVAVIQCSYTGQRKTVRAVDETERLAVISAAQHGTAMPHDRDAAVAQQGAIGKAKFQRAIIWRVEGDLLPAVSEIGGTE